MAELAKMPIDPEFRARVIRAVVREVESLRGIPALNEADIRHVVERGLDAVFERPKPRLLATDEALTALVDVVARAAGGGYCIESGRNPRMAALTALCGSLDIAEVNSVD